MGQATATGPPPTQPPPRPTARGGRAGTYSGRLDRVVGQQARVATGFDDGGGGGGGGQDVAAEPDVHDVKGLQTHQRRTALRIALQRAGN